MGPPREVGILQGAPEEGLGGSVTRVSRSLATPCDCSRENSEWDKLFIMLENSQMREGMLLQATDDVLRGELQKLRAELGRLAGSLARLCTPVAPAEARLARALDELLQASRDASRRLARLEEAGTLQPQEEAGRALGAVLEELRQTQADLRAVQGWAAGRWLPAGEDAGPGGDPHAASFSERELREAESANPLREALVRRNTHTPPSVSPCMVTELRHTIQGGKIAFKSSLQSRGIQRIDVHVIITVLK